MDLPPDMNKNLVNTEQVIGELDKDVFYNLTFSTFSATQYS